MARAKRTSSKPAPGFVLDNSIVMAWSFDDEETLNGDWLVPE